MVDCEGVAKGFPRGFLLGLLLIPCGGFFEESPLGRDTGGVVARFLVVGVVVTWLLGVLTEEWRLY